MASDRLLFIYHYYATPMYILVYVDDIIITRGNTIMVNQVFSSLALWFSIKDLDILIYFLGVEVLQRPDCLLLSQSHYINEILCDDNMLECNDVQTAMSSSKLFQVTNGMLIAYATRYRTLVGKLQYLSFT